MASMILNQQWLNNSISCDEGGIFMATDDMNGTCTWDICITLDVTMKLASQLCQLKTGMNHLVM